MDKNIDEIKEDIDKDVTQENTIDPSVERHLQEMGFLWDVVQDKLNNDKICFECKRALNLDKTSESPDKIHLLQANGVEKGVVAFVAICEECFDKAQIKFLKEQEKIKEQEDK